MSWIIRFESSVCYCSDGTMYPSRLSHRTSFVAAALLIYMNAVKSCFFSCYCVVVWCDFCCFVWCNFCCFVFVFSVVVVVVFSALVVGFWFMTYAIFATLFVGFRVLLCNYIESFLTCPFRPSGNFPLFWFSINTTRKKVNCNEIFYCNNFHFVVIDFYRNESYSLQAVAINSVVIGFWVAQTHFTSSMKITSQNIY